LQLTQRRASASQARSCIAWRCATERGQRKREESPALATPRVAAEPTPVRLTTRRRVSAGVAKREQRSPARPARMPRITPSSAACGE
jgi:hypothetical protein